MALRHQSVWLVASLVACSNRSLPVLDAAPTDAAEDAPFDPFDPRNACGSSVVPTSRTPGALLIVLDRSESMTQNNRWVTSQNSIQTSLGRASERLSAGLMFFPDGMTSCDVSAPLAAPISTLATGRDALFDALLAEEPKGRATPISAAVRRGWSVLSELETDADRALVLVTDGEEVCGQVPGNAEALRAEAAAYAEQGIYTYVLGLDIRSSFLSQLAVAGQTSRTSDCDVACEPLVTSCETTDDCRSGQTCVFPFPAPAPGVCRCGTSNAQSCPADYVCQNQADDLGFNPPSCYPRNCCNYSLVDADFSTLFQVVLDSIAGRLAAGCVVDVPPVGPGETFNPELLNVGVTFEGQPRQVLPRSRDVSVNSWNYTDESASRIRVQGPICTSLRAQAANIEVVLGCPVIIR